jgi:hypothetical protein
MASVELGRQYSVVRSAYFVVKQAQDSWMSLKSGFPGWLVISIVHVVHFVHFVHTCRHSVLS